MTFMNNELSNNAQALEHAINNRFKAERDSVYASDLESFMKTKSYHDFIVNEEQLYRWILYFLYLEKHYFY